MAVFEKYLHYEKLRSVAYGVVTSSSLNNIISRNKFKGKKLGMYVESYGILAYNTSPSSSSMNSYIIDNEFTDLKFGNRIEGTNLKLKIQCNSYTGHFVAIYINIDSAKSLFNDQGSCGLSNIPAKNKFYDRPGCNVIAQHIFSGSDANNNFSYSYNPNEPLEIPTCVGGTSLHLIPCTQVSQKSCIDIMRSFDSLCNDKNCNFFTPTQDITEGSKHMTLYPNPASDFLNIDFKSLDVIQEARLVVVDILGRRVKDVKLEKLTPQYSLDIQGVPNGTYFCTLLSNQRIVEVQKFVIVK